MSYSFPPYNMHAWLWVMAKKLTTLALSNRVKIVTSWVKSPRKVMLMLVFVGVFVPVRT